MVSRIAFAHDANEASAYTVQEIAEGNFVHEGNFPPQSLENRGDIANIGFIVGEKCVAVIDVGSSLHVGSMLKAAIQRVTRLPMRRYHYACTSRPLARAQCIHERRLNNCVRSS